MANVCVQPTVWHSGYNLMRYSCHLTDFWPYQIFIMLPTTTAAATATTTTTTTTTIHTHTHTHTHTHIYIIREEAQSFATHDLRCRACLPNSELAVSWTSVSRWFLTSTNFRKISKNMLLMLISHPHLRAGFGMTTRR